MNRRKPSDCEETRENSSAGRLKYRHFVHTVCLRDMNYLYKKDLWSMFIVKREIHGWKGQQICEKKTSTFWKVLLWNSRKILQIFRQYIKCRIFSHKSAVISHRVFLALHVSQIFYLAMDYISIRRILCPQNCDVVYTPTTKVVIW